MQNPTADQVAKAIKEANNVLITVKNSPSVDDLSAAIALTLLLNNLSKHATTVFSGHVPSTLEFLQPEMAIETNTDSLRDFIIALDKAKADKLRYKVEDNVVRIFITPYKTSITEKDLEFSQGDFNVDVVVALGVVTKEDFDQAVTVNGRILHDATVITVTNDSVLSEIGAINWQDQQASSVSEMITSILDKIGENVLDGQIATALLTGIVSETDRFKNTKTTPQVLAFSSRLMSAGANQQLVAEKLEEAEAPLHPVHAVEDFTSSVDGTLEIEHDTDEAVSKIHIDDAGNLEIPAPQEDNNPSTQQIAEQVSSEDAVTRSYLSSAEPPKMYQEDDSGTVSAQPLFGSGAAQQSASLFSQPAATGTEPSQQQDQSTLAKQTLSELEHSVGSQNQNGEEQPVSDDASSVDAFVGTPTTTPSIESTDQKTDEQTASKSDEASPVSDTPQQIAQPTPQVIDPTAPPIVPPPLMPQAPTQPQFFDADGSSNNPFLNPPQS